MLTLLPAFLLLIQASPDDWRAAANERIDRLRKAPVTVTVKDSAGRPVAGVEVRLQMKKHDFCFGTAIAAQVLLAPGETGDRYRKAFLDNFNCVVFENDLKWPQFEANPQRALDGLRWMREHGITRVRGHNLVWPSWRWLPKDVKGLASDPEAMRRRIFEHVTQVSKATRDWVTEWDVLNEPFTNYDLQRIVGEEEVLQWFRTAREVMPGVKLYLNDFSILEAPNGDLLHANYFYKYIEWMMANGAPLDGIGIQGHFSQPASAEYMLHLLDRFGKFGKPVTITEFDFNTKDEALQAQFTRAFLTVIFSHPSVDGLVMWGFWQGRHWLPDAAMLRRDWSPKPNYEVWRDLVFKQWWTDVTLRTGADGMVSTRGFRGEYEVQVAGTSVRTLILSGDGASVQITK